MFFLIGRGRSGTTLLKSILNAHPQISVAPEALFIMNVARYSGGGPWNERRVRNFGRNVFLEERMRRWEVTRQDLQSRWLALPDNVTFARRCAEVYEAQANATMKTAGRILGDKNPHYALFVHELAHLFPRAKFVHIVRDYRDNVVSYRNVPFDLSNTASLAYRWKHYNEVVMEAALRSPDRFHRVRFEDLIASPAFTMNDLCRFLGVEWNDAFLRNAGRTNDDAPEWHRHLSGPIDPRLAGQWRKKLSPKHVAIVDRICQPLGSALGYAPASEESTASTALWGIFLGWAVTSLERLLFRLPVTLRALIIKSYRHLTGNAIR